MRTQTNENQKVGAAAPTTSESFSYASQMAYHEMEDVPVRETDILEQLSANMQTLTDLQSRMNFMMREIRYLMKV